MKPSVSILIPVYNVSAYLRQCLESVCADPLKSLEIICINDGSTDDSLQILDAFADKDPRITVIDKTNTGYGDSMNLGLHRAKGKYIGIVEPDDYVEPGTFSKLYEVAEEFSADLVKANYYKFSSQKAYKTTENTAENSNIVTNSEAHPEFFQFAPAIWSALYRRQFLLDHEIEFLPTPGAAYQDLSFSFKVWATAERVVLLEDCFYHYRLDNANSSVNQTGKVNCVVDEYAEIETYLCERGLFPALGHLMEAAKFRNYHWNFQRLSPALAKKFYQTWRSEFIAAREDGLLERPDFTSKDWLALRAMLKYPQLTYHLLRLRSRLKHSS